MGDEGHCPDRVVIAANSPIAAKPAASSQLILAKRVRHWCSADAEN
jgi:hypothetical protein